MTTSAVEITPALQDAWQRQREAGWRAIVAQNVDEHRADVANVIATMPKPSLFNRRRDDVAQMVDTLLGLNLCWTSEVIYDCYHNPGWNHNRSVMVLVDERTLFVGERWNGDTERRFRLTEEQAQRFKEQGQRWAEQRAQYLAQSPSRTDLLDLQRQLREAAELHQEMARRPRSGHRRSGSDSDMDSWSTPSSPVPNPYNGWGGGFGG